MFYVIKNGETMALLEKRSLSQMKERQIKEKKAEKYSFPKTKNVQKKPTPHEVYKKLEVLKNKSLPEFLVEVSKTKEPGKFLKIFNINAQELTKKFLFLPDLFKYNFSLNNIYELGYKVGDIFHEYVRTGGQISELIKFSRSLKLSDKQSVKLLIAEKVSLESIAQNFSKMHTPVSEIIVSMVEAGAKTYDIGKAMKAIAASPLEIAQGFKRANKSYDEIEWVLNVIGVEKGTVRSVIAYIKKHK